MVKKYNDGYIEGLHNYTASNRHSSIAAILKENNMETKWISDKHDWSEKTDRCMFFDESDMETDSPLWDDERYVPDEWLEHAVVQTQMVSEPSALATVECAKNGADCALNEWLAQVYDYELTNTRQKTAHTALAEKRRKWDEVDYPANEWLEQVYEYELSQRYYTQ